MLDSPGFPRRIGDKYRLDTLLAWEERELAGLNVGLPRPRPPDCASSAARDVRPSREYPGNERGRLVRT